MAFSDSGVVTASVVGIRPEIDSHTPHPLSLESLETETLRCTFASSFHAGPFALSNYHHARLHSCAPNISSRFFLNQCLASNLSLFYGIESFSTSPHVLDFIIFSSS